MANKRLLLIILSVALLATAAVIIVVTMSDDLQTDAALKGKTTLLKCNTPDCGAVFEISMKDYYDGIQEKVMGASVPGLTCKKCGKDTAYMAVKCDKCGTVFFYASGSAADYADRCPKCSFSKSEDERKRGSQTQ